MVKSNQPKFICEFTTNHMGNLNILLEMVRKASDSGADYIKMQKKDVATFYSKEKLESSYPSPYGKTYYDYRKIFEFDKRSFDIFDEECKRHNIKWFSTAQDLESLDFLLQYDLDLYKIASTNSDKIELLKEFHQRIPLDKTIVISVAGRNLEEIENILSYFPNRKIILNHCVAEYPCKNHNLRLGNIKVLKEKFESDLVEIGYSGHEEGILPTYGAVLAGATCIERHFCLSRDSFVHHIECSLEPNEYKEMIATIRQNKIPPDVENLIGKKAFENNFGMTDMEKSFLLENTYGSDYLTPVL
jgi:sialic acid synthase SpsE